MEGEMLPHYSHYSHYGALEQLARDRRAELLAVSHSRRRTRPPDRSGRSLVRALLPWPAAAGLDSPPCST
jgi:hypothetical protein